MTDDMRQLARRISGLQSSLSDVKAQNRALQDRVEALEEFQEYARDRFDDIDEALNDIQEGMQEIQVNKERMQDLNLRLNGKVGNSDFNALEEKVKQVRRQIEYLLDDIETRP